MHSALCCLKHRCECVSMERKLNVLHEDCEAPYKKQKPSPQYRGISLHVMRNT